MVKYGIWPLIVCRLSGTLRFQTKDDKKLLFYQKLHDSILSSVQNSSKTRPIFLTGKMQTAKEGHSIKMHFISRTVLLDNFLSEQFVWSRSTSFCCRYVRIFDAIDKNTKKAYK